MTLAHARHEVAAMRGLRASLGTIPGRIDEARHGDLLQLRHALSAQIARIAAVCDPLFDAGPAAALAGDYDRHLSLLRTSLALHQANWPADRIDDDPIAYRASASVARSIENEFLTWIDAVLDALEGRRTLPVTGA